MRNHSAQHGFTLLELMAALAIGMLMLIGLTAMLDTALQDTKGQQTGQYQATFVAAATRYLNDEFNNTPFSSIPIGGTIAVTLAQLQAKDYLPLSFSATNAYRQTPCMLVRRPTAAQLDALVVTEGGDPIPNNGIGYVVANAGIGGGAITYDKPGDNTTPRLARGAYGGWMLSDAQLATFTTAQCSAAAADLGNLASALFSSGAGQNGADFLYRNPVSGQPALNKMNTYLGMGTGALAVLGTPCGTNNAIGMESSGRLLTCEIATGNWAEATLSQWKDPVANFAALPAVAKLGDVSITLDTGRAYTRNAFSATPWTAVTSWKPPVANYAALPPAASARLGDVYPTSDDGRAYMLDGSGNWKALAVDQNGDMIVPRDMRAETGLVVGRDVNALMDVNALRNVNAFEWLSGHQVELTRDPYLAGTACNVPVTLPDGTIGVILPTGTILRDPVGNTMMCKVPAVGAIGSLVYASTPP